MQTQPYNRACCKMNGRAPCRAKAMSSNSRQMAACAWWWWLKEGRGGHACLPHLPRSAPHEGRFFCRSQQGVRNGIGKVKQSYPEPALVEDEEEPHTGGLIVAVSKTYSITKDPMNIGTHNVQQLNRVLKIKNTRILNLKL